jgi:hypothetical protein
MKSAKWFVVLAFCFVLFAQLPACLPAKVADADTAKRFAKTNVVGEVRDGKLFVQIRPGGDERWPGAGPIDVWLAQLDGDRYATATQINDQRASGLIGAQVPYRASAGNEVLYVLRYRVGTGDDAVDGSLSLAEALGSLELRLIGPNAYQAGSAAAVRVVASDRFTGVPLDGAEIWVAFAGKDADPAVVYHGVTDAGGTCQLSFRVPDKPLTQPTLRATAAWKGQQAEVAETIQIKRDAKILLTTDKPLYQPGQTMHLRALAISSATRLPLADRDALLEVMDAKGNKVFKKAARADAFGIVHAQFTLAEEVNFGAYSIKVRLEESTAEKTVEVRRYVLPKFKVGIETDRAWYTPGQTVKGSVKADYLFGKPVSNGEVTITGLATIVGVETFATVQGKTDREGRFAFELKLTDTLVGREVDQGKARVQLQAAVTDPAHHKQEALRSFPVAKTPLVIQALPESGELVAGMRNRLYVMITSPDGSPVPAHVMVEAGNPPRQDNWWQTAASITADRLGLAEFEIDVPNQAGLTLTVRARDPGGNETAATLRLRPLRQEMPLLLRADQPTYRVGDVMTLTTLVGQTATPTVFFDLVRDNHTLLTTTGTVANGKATVTIPLSADLAGGVVATAYAFTPSGNAVRDSRVVYVHPAADLRVEIRPGKATYRPGEKASVDFTVTDTNGHPVAAALGITIVDEAVFALQDMQPGLEKIFFTLEKELMTPRYEVHQFNPAFVVLDPQADLVKRRGQAVMLAAVKPLLQPAIDRKMANDLRPPVREALERQVQADLRRLTKLYEKHKGQTAQIKTADLADPWFTPYRVNAWNGVVYQVTSAGPDRKFYTADDVNAYNEQANRGFGKARRARGGGGGGIAMDRMANEEAFDFEAAGDAGAVLGAPMAGAMLKAAEARDKREETKSETKKDGGGVRIREFFPETLFVNPALITGGDGRARIELDMADSITTWRIAAQAISRMGWLGSGTAPVRVFQDFFVDIDFPATLTRGDAVKVPIALYNYLPKTQTVTLKIESADWFGLLEGDLTRRVTLGPNEVKAEFLHVKAATVGRHDLTVLAKGTSQSDAVKRSVLVEPDGKMNETNISDRLPNEARHTVTFPAGMVPGANKLFIKLHPGLMSQVVEGLDNIFKMPFGCFEQTSSTTYPNIMVLDYLKATRQITPELQMKAEGFINQGYQRLLTFEVPGGGFEWFGRPPAHVILTAYGLMEFYDMSRVYNVDEDVIRRTQNWLASKQQGDGSWQPNAQFLDAVASAFGKDVLRNTAYVVWALGRTGYQGDALKKGRAYLEAHHADAKDPYTLALLANALVDSQAKEAVIDAVFQKLDGLRRDEGEFSYWPSGEPTAMYGNGKSGDIETTALAGLALLHAKRQPHIVNRVVTYLIKSKDAFGTYHSTQATVWALHVLLGVARGGGGDTEGQFQAMVNGRPAGTIKITAADNDVLRMLDATTLLRDGDNEIVLSFAGKGAPAYQIVSRYYVPWAQVTDHPREAPIAIDVQYDKTRLSIDEEVTCTVNVVNRAPGDFGMVVVDIGVPPGFAPVGETLSRLVEGKKVSKFSTTARQITFYVDKLEMNKPLTLTFRLTAVLAMHAATPQSKVYNYYDPQVQAIAKPVSLTVK